VIQLGIADKSQRRATVVV